MILKSCANCGALILYGSTYCKDCEPIMQAKHEARRCEQRKKYNKKYDEHRTKKYRDFYNQKAWRRLAAQYMADKHYRCERCGAIAENVHHKQPIQTPEGWARRFDYSNLELLCVSCHNLEHGRFLPKKSKR